VSDSLPLDEGTVVAGKLRIVRLLGMGGMGAVYEVEHAFTKHRRALKLLHPEMLEHPMVVARFLREASAAGHIGNAHIVETFDAGTLEGGEPYIVMEMLEGETLASRLEREQRLPVGELADLVRQACDGVQAAHAAGIVHRDLKPENLFVVQRDGKPFVKVLDFGISKFDRSLVSGGGRDANASTKEGSSLGTPYYMSPEQVDGDKDLDARTDVYALGVILYECASGQRPYVAEALPKLAVLIHVGKPERLSGLRPELPRAFVDVVHKAMARDKGERFQTAAELGSALAPFGREALDATMPELTGVRGGSSRPPPAVRATSEPPATGASSEPPSPGAGAARGAAAVARPSGKTMGGSSLSVAREKPRATGGGRVVALVAIGALVLGATAVVMTTRGGAGGAGGAPIPATAEPFKLPVVGSATPSALPPLPAATVSAIEPVLPAPSETASTRSPASAGTASAGTASAALSSAGPSRVAKPPRGVPSGAPPGAKPAGSTRADQRGLAGENPFQ